MLLRLFTLFLFIALLPISSAGDCGLGYTNFYGYTFINPEITEFDAELAPFFLDFTKIHEEFFKSQTEVYQKDNATEWMDRYCGNAKLADIQQVVYKSSRYQLEDLLSIIDNPNGQLSRMGPLASNSWVRYLHRHQCRETVSYLVFAKRCEPHVIAPKNSWQKIERNESAMRTLIREAKDKFIRTESDYIKLRYAFQAIRLAHYIKDYELTLELVDYYMPKIDHDPSILEYWIMGHQAGALQALGDYPQSAYLYSRIFEKCPGKRESAYRSFRIDTDEEWNACLLLCKNNHERANLYVLRANSHNAQLITEMKNIYAYDPEHHALEMLLVKEMQRLERDLLGESFNPKRKSNRNQHNIPRAYAGERVIELQGLIREWLDEGSLIEPKLWKLALGYLEVLAGDYYYAKRTFAELGKQLGRKEKTLKEQLDVFQLVLRIISMDNITEKDERELSNLGNKYDFYATYSDFSRMISDKIRLLYVEQGDGAKSYLMEYSLEQLMINPDLEIIDELIALCRKEDRTPFEDALVVPKVGTTIEKQLLNAKATYLMGEGLLESALRVMQEIPVVEWDEYGQFNPFVRRFKDCVHCKLPDTVTIFNRGQLIEKMLEIEYDARAATNPD
ncbi:MAG: hypothetical protein AAGJ93_07085, partial [Bacteroidota bacterium]